MREKVLLTLLVFTVLIVNAILVVAISSNFSNEDIKGLKNDKLKLISSGVKTIEDSNENIVLDGDEDDLDEDEKEDVPITGSALEKASTAALEYIGEGKVTDTEIGDEEGYYEIEITFNNGREVDAHLDKDFNVLGKEYE